MRRTRVIHCSVIGLIVLALLVALPAEPPVRAQGGGQVLIKIYGGVYEKVFKKLNAEFAQKTGIQVRATVGAGSELPMLEAQVKAGKGGIDITLTQLDVVMQGKKLGLFETIRSENVPNLKLVYDKFRDPDGRAVGAYVFWMIIGYNTKKVSGKPTAWADLWDPKYKGQVTAYKDLMWGYLLPIAAAVAGVPQEELKTEAGREKAWRKLDGLKAQVRRWYTGGADLQQVFASEDAVIGAAWNGRVFDSKSKGVPVDAVWPREGGIVDFDNYVIVKGTRNRDAAEKYLNYLLSPEVQMVVAKEIGYGPTTKGTAERLDPETRHKTFGPQGAIDRAIVPDYGWYLADQKNLNARFTRWLTQ